MNDINISKDLEKSILPESLIITDSNKKATYKDKTTFLNENKKIEPFNPIVGVAQYDDDTGEVIPNTTYTNEDVLSTESIIHHGKVFITNNWWGIDENSTGDFSNNDIFSLHTHNIISSSHIVNQYGYTYLGSSLTFGIAVDLVNGNDNVEIGIRLNSPNSYPFKSLDAAIMFCARLGIKNCNITVFNSTSVSPAQFGVSTSYGNAVISNMYIFITIFGTGYLSVYQNGIKTRGNVYLYINCPNITMKSYTGSNGTQIDGNSTIYLEGGLGSTYNTLNLEAGCVNAFDSHIGIGTLKLSRNWNINFNQNNQSLFRATRGDSYLSVENIIVNTGAFTGCKLVNTSASSPTIYINGTPTLPSNLSLADAKVVHPNNITVGATSYNNVDKNYSFVGYSTTPIKTPNMNNATTDMTGTVKAVVVNSLGEFGVKTISGASKFYVQQALSVGSNTITHNLNLTTPKALSLEIRNDADGTLQVVPITGYTTNSITVNITTAITLANITIIG